MTHKKPALGLVIVSGFSILYTARLCYHIANDYWRSNSYIHQLIQLVVYYVLYLQ